MWTPPAPSWWTARSCARASARSSSQAASSTWARYVSGLVGVPPCLVHVEQCLQSLWPCCPCEAGLGGKSDCCAGRDIMHAHQALVCRPHCCRMHGTRCSATCLPMVRLGICRWVAGGMAICMPACTESCIEARLLTWLPHPSALQPDQPTHASKRLHASSLGQTTPCPCRHTHHPHATPCPSPRLSPAFCVSPASHAPTLASARTTSWLTQPLNEVFTASSTRAPPRFAVLIGETNDECVFDIRSMEVKEVCSVKRRAGLQQCNSMCACLCVRAAVSWVSSCVLSLPACLPSLSSCSIQCQSAYIHCCCTSPRRRGAAATAAACLRGEVRSLAAA